MPGAIPYPPALTNKEWQKAKGLLGKIAVGKTDIGAGLTSLQGTYAKSDFAKAPALFDKFDPAEFAVFVKTAKTNLGKQAGDIGKEIESIKKGATAAASDLKTSKVPAKVATDVGKAIAAIVSGLDAFGKQVAAAPDAFVAEMTDDFRKKLKANAFFAALKQSCGSVETKWKAVLPDIKKVEADPKIATVEKVFAGDNNVRGITTAAKFWDQVVSKTFPTTASKIYTGKAMADYYALPCLAEIGDQKGGVTLEKLVETSGQPEDRVVTAYMLKLSSSVVKSHELVNHMKAVLSACESV